MVVLLPGHTDSWRSYRPVEGRLASSVRAIAVSPRGHGHSDKPPAGYGVHDFAGDVPPLLDALGIDRAVLAGHFGSCLVARRIAIDQPERVAGLVLEASPTTLRGHVGLIELVSTVVSGLEDPIVWGDADALVDRDIQATLTRQLRDAELIVYHGVGHAPRWEDPTRFARDVAAFTHRVLPHRA